MKSTIRKGKHYELDYIKIKSFYLSKDTMKGVKMQAIEWRIYMQYMYLTKDLYADYKNN